MIHCTTFSLYSTKASKITFLVWFQLVALPEIQFQPSMLIPTIDIEILEHPSLSVYLLRTISSSGSFKKWILANLANINHKNKTYFLSYNLEFDPLSFFNIFI